MRLLARPLAITLGLVLMFGLVILREATSPSGDGYFAAMAAAPGGGLYLADQGRRQLLLLRPGQAPESLGDSPPGAYRTLAGDGPNLLLGTIGRLYRSTDGGRHWSASMSGRFTAVAVRGNHELAASWAKGIFVSDDAGLNWSRSVTPTGDTEVESMLPSGYAATLLGLLRSADGGHTWERVPGIPDELTSVVEAGDGNIVRAGDWRGAVWSLQTASGAVERSAAYPGGVITMAGAVVATTVGLYPDQPGPLHGREVVAIASSGDGYFAAAARGPVYWSPDGRSWALAGNR